MFASALAAASSDALPGMPGLEALGSLFCPISPSMWVITCEGEAEGGSQKVDAQGPSSVQDAIACQG